MENCLMAMRFLILWMENSSLNIAVEKMIDSIRLRESMEMNQN